MHAAANAAMAYQTGWQKHVLSFCEQQGDSG